MPTAPFVKVIDLKKWFPIRQESVSTFPLGKRKYVKAVDGVTFELFKDEIVALSGESGCGKTTIAKLLVNLIEPTGGRIYIDGQDLNSIRKDKAQTKNLTRKVQMIFQEPYEYLSPWLTVGQAIAEPAEVHNLIRDRSELYEAVREVMSAVGLVPPDLFIKKYPRQLSGGERQRVVVARALILRPQFIVADEPTSMIDVSIKLGLLNIMVDIKDKSKIGLLYITHDLAIAKYVSDRIMVMYLGKIVEKGETERVIDDPLHPYTTALLFATPMPDPNVKRSNLPIKGAVYTSVPASGCRFAPRCLYAKDVCRKEEPELREVEKGRFVACHLVR